MPVAEALATRWSVSAARLGEVRGGDRGCRPGVSEGGFKDFEPCIRCRVGAESGARAC